MLLLYKNNYLLERKYLGDPLQTLFRLNGSTNAGSGTTIEKHKYYFDQPGEYRIITSNLSGTGGNNAMFFPKFTDGDYPTGANQGPCNPTTP